MFLAEWVLWWWNECLKHTSYLTKADEDNVTHKNLWNTLQFYKNRLTNRCAISSQQISRLYNLNFTMTVVYLTDVWSVSTTSEERFYSKVCLQSHVSFRLTPKISKTSICCSLSTKNRYSDLNHWAHTVNAICRVSLGQSEALMCAVSHL